MVVPQRKMALNESATIFWLIIPVVAILLILATVILQDPLAFNKFVSIKEGPPPPPLLIASSRLDVASLIGRIPYKPVPEALYAVEPALKFHLTIEEGRGNCSNLVFGIAYYLDQHGIDYQIIHVLKKEDFLHGVGHVLIRVPYTYKGESRVGLVDVLEGGLPLQSGHLMSLGDLANDVSGDVSILSLNPATDAWTPYYGKALKNTVVGYMTADEVNRYMDFIHRIYFPLGSLMAEKYLYDGASILLGFYPKIYVASLQETFGAEFPQQHFYVSVLWAFRILGLLLPVLLVACSVLRYREIRDGPSSG